MLETVGQVLLVMLGIAGVVSLAALVGVVLLVRRVRRSRRVRRAALVARSVGGPAARATRLRLDLDRAMRATTTALAAAQAEHRPVGDLPHVVAQLAAEASALDARLRDAAAEPNPRLRQELTAELQRAVREHGKLAADVRSALRAGESHRLEATRRSLDVEREALAAWQTTYRETLPRAGA